MKEITIDYTTFKSLVSAKVLLPQYVDNETYYNLFAVEDNLAWQCFITKDGGNDQTDFEVNYQSTCNKPLEYRSIDGLPKYASALFTDSASYWVDGSNGVMIVNAGQTVYVKTNFSVPFKINGVDVHWANANVGDYVNFEVGIYTGAITDETTFVQMAQFGNQYRIMGTDTKMFDTSMVSLVPPTYNGLNVYIRTTYVNTGASNATLLVNLLGYK